jgi:hypothetical protein
VIEGYAFLAAFAVQILAASVLSPARLIKYVRGWARDFGSDRFAQLYPGADYGKFVERFVRRYRAVNTVIALVGLILFGWMFTLLRQPDWTQQVSQPALWYFLLQMSPLILVGLYGVVRARKLLLQPSQEVKRKATLQRRGLFDFVSPFVVLLAVASYPLFVAYAIYLDLAVYHNTSLSKPCLIAIGSITLVYALNTFIIYRHLYGRRNPLLSNEGRAHSIEVTVKAGVYGSIAVTLWYAIFGTLGQPGLQDWRPFALSALYVLSTLLGLLSTTAPRRRPDAVVSA